MWSLSISVACMVNLKQLDGLKFRRRQDSFLTQKDLRNQFIGVLKAGYRASFWLLKTDYSCFIEPVQQH